MSFQSLLENAECGSTNPMVDLARQFTSGQTVTNSGEGGDAILSIDELNGLRNLEDQSRIASGNNSEFHSGLESLLNNDDNNPSPFNMDDLLKEMNRLDSALGSLNNETPKANNLDPDIFKTDVDPLICNQPKTIEEDFWKEANSQLGFETEILDFQRYSRKLPELNVDWADEYLKRLELNNNSLSNQTDDLHGKRENLIDQPQNENVWDLNEKEHIETEQQKSYRSQTVEDVDSFFSGSYSPFIRRPVINAEMISDANLNDLVSDQESRLINMLLGNNPSNEVQSSPIESNLIEKESEVEDRIEEQSMKARSNLENVQEQISNKDSENFFYENQFDDIEFWMKLAEEWHSNDQNSSDLQSDLTYLGEDGKIIQIREPLSNLLDKNNPYCYKYVENNPFLRKSGNEISEKKARIDYIEEGIRRMEAGDLSAAVLLFEASTQTKPEDVNGWRLLGIANAKNENDRKSIAALKRCLALEPPIEISLETLMYLATSFTNESMNTEACYALQEWLKLHPKYKKFVCESNKDAEQESNLNNEPYLGPTPLSQRWTNRKNIFANGFFESLKQSFINAALSSPEPDPDIQCGLGVLHNISGEYSKAIDCFQASLKIRPDDYCLWNRYGASLANGGRAEESMFAYREALLRYPGYIRARYNLAISCLMLGEGQQASKHLLAILNLQTAGADSIRDLVSLDRDNITSASVWSLMRSALSLQGRSGLLNAVDERDLDILNRELDSESQPETEPKIKDI